MASIPSASLRLPESALRGLEGPAPSFGPQTGAPRPFAEVLKEALQQVNRLQAEAQAQAEALARGEVTDMHSVTLAIERAQLALELTIAVRNKLLEAYQEISRMQV